MDIDEKLDSINSIDEKLEELKNTVESPEYNDLLGRFKWTRKWFKQAEDALLAMAYRGESDKPIIDFIRAKIIKIDVLTFNDVLRNFGAAPILNHYQMISDMQPKQHFAVGNLLILSNENVPIVDYVLKNKHQSLKNISRYLSYCLSDIAVDYLLANPDEIDDEYFYYNDNINAIKYNLLFQNRSIISCLENNNDDLVDIMLSAPDLDRVIFHTKFCMNPNDRVVDHLLANPSTIDYDYFSRNTNSKAVAHLLENPDKIDHEWFSRNTNNKAVEYMLANPDKIDYEWYSENDNDKAVDHMLANPDKIVPSMMYYNNNDRAVDYILNQTKYDVFEMNCNACNYNMQKINAANSLGLFPRLPHLRL